MMIQAVPDKRVVLENDGKVAIATGSSRFCTAWKNKEILWSQLIGRLAKSSRIAQTHYEFCRKLSRARQDDIKDIGGFVGGHLKEGHRKKDSVECRQLITLDFDDAPEGADIGTQLTGANIAHCVYSTLKHCPEKPRYRLIIPMDRPVGPDAYEAIARKVVESMDAMEWLDVTTYQPERLMYWPAHCSDIEPVFEYFDGEFLRADEWLGRYPDWTDMSYWPQSNKEKEERKRYSEKQQNPLEKNGIVGLFCRTYTISGAIAKFLPDVYAATAKDDRYTYSAGSTFGGLVVYDDVFAYSNHSTDPASMQTCNAFDLVRIHKFGHLDTEGAPSGSKAPSYKAMAQLAAEDPEVKVQQSEETRRQAAQDFAPLAEGEDWREKLKKDDKSGGVVPDARNAQIIMTYDKHLQGIRRNEMSGRIEAEGVPWDMPDKHWRDVDDDQLYMWIVREHGVQFPDAKFFKALNTVADNRRFHPIREYLDDLPEWDGVERAEKLLVDYLGAEDNAYVREVTRKTLTAAVTRIYEPGIKFDHVLVLVGAQGRGKSTLFSRLAGEWFSDALTLTDMKDKTGAELVQGHWIMELGEMAGMRKADVESVKSFVSRQVDTYRPAYGRVVESHPRQCIIVGSTNAEGGFLRDITGNRRFWPVSISGGKEMHSWDLTPETVAQIWAEVKLNYVLGENLFLEGEAERLAEGAQRDAMETDERQGLVEKYLDKLLPECWQDMDLDKRMLYLHGEEGTGVNVRQTVSNVEIWTECFGQKMSAMQAKDSYAIAAIMARIPGWARTNSIQRSKLYGRQRIYKRVKP